MILNLIRRPPLSLLLATMVACFSWQAMADDEIKAQAMIEESTNASRVLVMLDLPPAHFRPDVSYNGNYQNEAGSTARRRIAENLARQYQLKLVDNWPMPTLGIDCYVMEGGQDSDPIEVAALLSKESRVKWAQPIQTYEAMASQSQVYSIQANAKDPLYSIQPSTKYWHLRSVHKRTTGLESRVAIIDSGIDEKHPDLLQQVVLKENFVEGNPYVAESHGTQVAGVIAARSHNDLGIVGIAPHAQIMALRACWEKSQRTICDSFSLAKALHFAILNKAKIINLSLSGPSDKLLQRLIQTALDRGIFVVAAVNPEGNSSSSFPASYPGVIAVSDKLPQDKNSNWLVAPGAEVPTTTTKGRWTVVAGSSYSAAHVSGMLALLTQIRPSITPAQFRSKLVMNTTNATDRSGNIDICATIHRMTGVSSCTCAP